jgi:hypothetical protein
MSVRWCRCLTGLFILSLAAGSPVAAKNPLAGFFSRLLDESRAEMAIGTLLLQRFALDTAHLEELPTRPELDAITTRLAPGSTRPGLPYKVYVLENPVPGDIPFPGGPIVLTTGLLALATDSAQLSFLIARNIILISQRAPTKVLKQQGLYASLLRHFKQAPAKRNPAAIRLALRDYLKSLPDMDHREADRRALALTPDPDTARLAAMRLLQRQSEQIIPLIAWDAGDLQGRLEALAEPPKTAPPSP